jgi:hypothetical protein
VFYEKDLVTKDYRLLHSNAIGELQNPRWKQTVGATIDMPDDEKMKRDDYTRGTNETDDYVY